jgi:D-sedoheptulose 7-phosphate isomerase
MAPVAAQSAARQPGSSEQTLRRLPRWIGTQDFTMTYTPQIIDYLNRLTALLKNVDPAQIDRFIQTLQKARQQGRNIYTFGNGGSGSTASHMACDLNKGCSYGIDDQKRFRVICLNDNVATMLAYANDVCYDDVFLEQLKNFLQPGDVVIGISGSGNSKNVLRAIEYANAHGGVTVGVCGYIGGELERVAQVAVHPRVNDMQLVEDFHLILCHMTMQALGFLAHD